MIPASDLQDVLHRYWGYSTFRPLQREAMDAVLAGRDSVVVLPTGGGKSLCFQAPAVMQSGLALVVSPLISLMKDQVDTLVGNGVPAALYNSSLAPGEKAEVITGLRQGRYRLLYVSPERLVGDGGEGFLNLLSSCGVSFIAVDEAHCISQWGHDFRPEYRQLGRLRQLLPGVGLHAYTATATARIRKDIAAQLGLNDPVELVGSFDRSEPRLPGPAPRDAQEAAYRTAGASPARSRHHLLHVATRNRGAGGVADDHRHHGAAVSRGVVGRGTQPQPGRVPQRARGRDRRDRRVRHGHRPIGRALRRARGIAAFAGALPAGIRARRPRRARSRMPADLLHGRFPEVARDARAERRADRRRPAPAPADGGVRHERRLPPQTPVRVFRRPVRTGQLRGLRLLPRRAGIGRRSGPARAQDPLGRGARRPAVRRRARRQRAARERQRNRSSSASTTS